MLNNSTLVKRPSSTRSRVSNGRRSFIEGDGRSVWARRFRDLVELHVADLGGADALTEAQSGLCKRIATIECELERMEGQLSLGQQVDFDLYGRLSGNLRRLCEAVGIKSGATKPDADLSEYLKRKGSGR